MLPTTLDAPSGAGAVLGAHELSIRSAATASTDKGIKVRVSDAIRVLDPVRPNVAPAGLDRDSQFVVNDIRNFTLSWKLRRRIVAMDSSATTRSRRSFPIY
jgi:hypothetical protein